MNVVYLCEYGSVLGGEKSLLTFLAHRRAELNPLVVAPASGRLADELAKRQLACCPWTESGKRHLDELARTLRGFRPDLVHANSLKTADAAGELGQLLGVPALAHVRDIMKLSKAQCARLHGLAALIAVSPAVAEALVAQALAQDLDLDSARVFMIPNAVAIPHDEKKNLSFTNDHGLPYPRPRLACIGQIGPRKGQDLFLEAANLVANTLTSAQFFVIGERYSTKPESVRFESDLHTRARKPGLSGRVHWLGYRSDMLEILPHFDCVVVPSRQEPLSRVLLEAMAARVPAIATDVGGNAFLLDQGQCGVLVPSHHPQALAAAMVAFFQQPHVHQQRAETARRRVEEHFAPARQESAIWDVYSRLRASISAIPARGR